MLQHLSSRIPPLRFRPLVTVGVALLALPACGPSSEEPSAAVHEQAIAASAGVIRITATGTGCPPGSWRARVSADRARVVLAFGRFASDASVATDKRCDVRVSLAGAEGDAYAPAFLHVRGEVDGDAATDGEASIATRIGWTAGDATEETVNNTVVGPFDDTDDLPQRWSSCGGSRELRVRPQLSVAHGRAAIYEQEIGFVARRCAQERAPDASAPPKAADSVESAPAANAPQLSKSANCPNSTAASGAEGLTVLLPAHNLELAAPTPAAQKACYLQFDHVVAQGKTYAFQSYVVEGTANLAENTNATVRAVPYVFGAGWESRANGQVLQSSLSLEGPRVGAFKSEVSFSDEELQFAPCSEGSAARLSLDVLTDITSVSPPSQGGTLSVARVSAIKFKEKPCAP